MPEDYDLSSVQFQNSVNKPNEDIYGILIKLRVEVMLGRRVMWLDDLIRTKQDIHQIPDETMVMHVKPVFGLK